MPVTVVTGGTRGIGAAISRRVASGGGHVAAIYHADDAAAQKLVTTAKADGLDISAHRAELADVGACTAVMAEITGTFGPVQHLVSNAGILREATVTETTVEMWDAVHDVNCRAAFFLAQAVWPGMVKEGYGRIVNVGSVTGMSGNPVEAAYGASKAALIGLTRSLARAGARKGITVNCVVPGVYETEMTASMSERDQQRIAAMIPAGRRGRPKEMAHLVAALLHADAGYITGAVIMADGGLGMGA